MKATIRFKTDPIKRVEGLKKQLQTRALKKAVKAAAAPVVDAVQSSASSIRKYGFLSDSIGTKIKGYTSAVAAIVGPKSKYKRRKGTVKRGKKKGQPIIHIPAHYAHLLERGTKRSKAKPFLKPSLDRTKAIYMETVRVMLGNEISRYLSK